MARRSLVALALTLLALAPRAIAQSAAAPATAPSDLGPSEPAPGLPPLPAEPGARVLGLAEAETLAVKHSPDLAVAEQALSGQEDARKSLRGAFLPSIDVSANYSVFNSPYNIPLMFAGVSTTLLGRDQVTSMETVQVTEPISGLYAIDRAYDAEKANSQAAHEDVAAAGSDLRQQVIESYIHWMLARRLEEVANGAVAAAEGHLSVAQASEKVGELSKLDVARAEVGADRAKQDLIMATARAETAKTALALLLGIDPGQPLVPDTAPFPDAPPASTLDLDAAEKEAFSRRPELHAIADREQAAEANAGAAWASLFPEIAVVGGAQHQSGIPFGVPFNQAWVGGVLSWKAWDWGRTYYKARAASANEGKLDAREQALRDAVYLDVKRQILDVNAAYQALAVGREGVGAATTAEKFETDRYAQGVATTSDVLDSDADLERAQVSYAEALYDYYLARADLAHAIGEDPASGASAE